MAYLGKESPKHKHVVLGCANVMWIWFSDQLPFSIPYSNCRLVNTSLLKFWVNSPSMRSDECSQVHTGQALATISHAACHLEGHPQWLCQWAVI